MKFKEIFFILIVGLCVSQVFTRSIQVSDESDDIEESDDDDDDDDVDDEVCLELNT
jgi:hypothetical protein